MMKKYMLIGMCCTYNLDYQIKIIPNEGILCGGQFLTSLSIRSTDRSYKKSKKHKKKGKKRRHKSVGSQDGTTFSRGMFGLLWRDCEAKWWNGALILVTLSFSNLLNPKASGKRREEERGTASGRRTRRKRKRTTSPGGRVAPNPSRSHLKGNLPRRR